MVAVSMAQGLRCGSCHRLYAYLDARQGTRSWAVKGAGEVADRLSWQLQTAQKHLRHLADVGIVALDPEPVRAWGNTVVRLRHAPARGRFADLRPLAGVWEPEPERRWRQPARSREELDRLRSPDAWRDAPAAPVEDVRTHSATRQPEREPEKVHRTSPAGAPHQLERRDAPSVPGSLRRSKDCLSDAERAREAAVPAQPAACKECGEDADGRPGHNGTRWCRDHEPFWDEGGADRLDDEAAPADEPADDDDQADDDERVALDERALAELVREVFPGSVPIEEPV